MKEFCKRNIVLLVLISALIILISGSNLSLLINSNINFSLLFVIGTILIVVLFLCFIIKKGIINKLNKIFNVFIDKLKLLKRKFIIKNKVLNRIDIITSMQINNSKSLSKKNNNKFLSFIIRIIIFILTIVGLKYAISYFQIYAFVSFNYALLAAIIIMFIILSVFETSSDFVNTIYKGKDNSLLLSYPVKPSEVFASKLIVRYILEFKKVLSFVLPLLIAFYLEKSLTYSLNAIYFVKSIYVIILIPLFIVLISAMLSALLAVIDYVCRKFSFIKKIITLLVFGVIAFIVISLVNSLPLNLPLLKLWFSVTSSVIGYLSNIVDKTLFTNKLLYFMMGFSSLENFVITLIEMIVLVLIVSFICFPFFFKLSSSSIEFSSSKVYKTKMKQNQNIFFVFLNKEIKNYFRSDDNIMVTFLYLLILPILIYCLNRIFYSLNISSTGRILIICINVLISITLLTASNISSASSLSREGNEFYLLKISPVDTKMICFAKCLVNFFLSNLAILSVGFSLSFTHFMKINDIMFICIVLFFVNTGHICWCFELDILNPKIAQYSAGEEIINNNPNVRKSITIGLILAIIFTFLSYFFYIKYNEGAIIGPVRVIIVAFMFCVVRIYLFVVKIKVYFNEITM